MITHIRHNTHRTRSFCGQVPIPVEQAARWEYLAYYLTTATRAHPPVNHAWCSVCVDAVEVVHLANRVQVTPTGYVDQLLCGLEAQDVQYIDSYHYATSRVKTAGASWCVECQDLNSLCQLDTLAV